MLNRAAASEAQSHSQGAQEAPCFARPMYSITCQYNGGPNMYIPSTKPNKTVTNLSTPGLHEMPVPCAIPANSI